LAPRPSPAESHQVYRLAAKLEVVSYSNRTRQGLSRSPTINLRATSTTRQSKLSSGVRRPLPLIGRTLPSRRFLEYVGRMPRSCHSSPIQIKTISVIYVFGRPSSARHIERTREHRLIRFPAESSAEKHAAMMACSHWHSPRDRVRLEAWNSPTSNARNWRSTTRPRRHDSRTCRVRLLQEKLETSGGLKKRRRKGSARWPLLHLEVVDVQMYLPQEEDTQQHKEEHQYNFSPDCYRILKNQRRVFEHSAVSCACPAPA
jgi:hypothetical protein